MSLERLLLAIAFGLALVMLPAWVLLRKMKLDWFGSHLRDLPVNRLRYLLAARFLRMASVGFLLDLVRGGSMSRPLVLLMAFLFGLCGPLVLLLRHRPAFQRLLFVKPIICALVGIAGTTGMASMCQFPPQLRYIASTLSQSLPPLCSAHS
jgi:hypothetical protein